ncbi:ABC transporter permease [Petralouisia muris]|uniref:ABC transporter permease n=1 Tax=Petralouisia muris TaxID=3032872 RepID=A0AC61RZ39_9FIRM|nr:ABC transporter permease [Petralouisia muris]TGY97066.1 ABC transporter permease [Petralouisia muris]
MSRKSVSRKPEIFWNRRRKILFTVGAAFVYLLAVLAAGMLMSPERYGINYSAKFTAPCLEHPFGTDYMGRDMFFRSIKGLSNSIAVGALASAVSSLIALALGLTAALKGGIADRFVNWCVDLCMGIPHLILLILISFMMGRGGRGVTAAVALTHWPELTRLVRAEALQIRSARYVQASYRMGKTWFQVAKEHMVPQVLPVYLIGVVLLFPHAIMHEAAVTFLGFGFPAEIPAIGVILSESMDYITTGKWWMAVFPGLMLLAAVMLFDAAGENLKRLLNPNSGNE